MLINFAVVETVLHNIVLLLRLVMDIFVLLFHIWCEFCVCLKYVVIVTAIEKYQMNINVLNTTLIWMTETHANAKCGRDNVITDGRH